MAEMNVIPLVDIMLVLLVIFIITAPVLSHAVKIDMPQASSELNEENPAAITLSVDADGQLYWDDEPMAYEGLQERLSQAVRNDANVELQLRAEKSTAYDHIARIMAAGRNAGVAQLGFVMEPE